MWTAALYFFPEPDFYCQLLGEGGDGGIGEPERTRHRLLSHEKFQTQLVQFAFHLIDAAIAQNHAIGNLPVSLAKSPDAIFQRPLAESSHARETLPDSIQILFKRSLEVSSHVGNQVTRRMATRRTM